MGKSSRPLEKAERLLAGFSPSRLSEADAAAYASRWRKTFAARVLRETGTPTHLGFDWHAFSYAYAYAVSGDAAQSAYRARQRSQSFLVLLGATPSDGFACQADTLPWFDRAGLDVYVVASDFRWTMVFTHEADWCGPYFTTAEWAIKPPDGAV
ncbi:MAG: DUF4275 family protein [Myxococcales bacterium]|nr:DUF4275 family protein [Myxococcales bacterium]